MRTYANVGPRNVVTPQREPIPGSGQKKNHAGGYAWEVDDWGRLQRFLILGTEGGAYYVKERALTRENAAVVERCIQADGLRVVRTIVEISQSGRAPKNDPAIFALAMAASLGDQATKRAAFDVLPKVARIGTHLLHFVSFVEQFRGWGRGLRKAVAAWFNEKTPKDLAYQLTKYPQRDKWALRDVLRLAHVKPVSEDHARLLRYAVGKGGIWTEETPYDEYLSGVQIVGSTTVPKVAADVIRGCRLPREVIPTELLKSPDVWDALLDDMPMTALIRNLATLTRVGVVAPLSDGTRRVLAQLGDAGRIRKARVHPIQVLAALLTYKSGHGARGNGTWTPVAPVVDALDAAFYTAFGNVPASGKRTMLALDVSGSMDGGQVAGIPGLTPRVAAACMAMVTAKTEPMYAMMAFSHQPVPLDISAVQRLDDVVRKMMGIPFGGTDCALPMLVALHEKVSVDTFVIYTDSETWAGRMHPSQALREYREKTGINAKLVVVGMVSNGFSIADPRDAGMLDVVGFDTATPQVISEFSAA